MTYRSKFLKTQKCPLKNETFSVIFKHRVFALISQQKHCLFIIKEEKYSIFVLIFAGWWPPKRRTAAVNCVPNHSYLYDTSFLFTGCRVEYSLSSLQGRFLSFKGIVMASFSKHQLVDISVRSAQKLEKRTRAKSIMTPNLSRVIIS